jgi:archaellum component FlaC
MDVEGEIRDLKRRVGELEGGFGFLTQQVRAVHLDVLNFQDQTNQRFDKVDGRLDKVEGRLDRVEAEVRSVKAEVIGLREELPTIVGDVMREVLREQKG